LGASISAAPAAAAVMLPAAAALPEHTSLVGWCFGSQGVPNSLNVRQYVSRGLQIPFHLIDHEQAALAWAFQTWIGQGDWQCLIGGGDGRIYSLDHENFAAFEQPGAAITDVAGHDVLGKVGAGLTAVTLACDRIEGIADELIRRAVD